MRVRHDRTAAEQLRDVTFRVEELADAREIEEDTCEERHLPREKYHGNEPHCRCGEQHTANMRSEYYA